MKSFVTILLPAIIILSCRNTSKYSYAIRDFSHAMEPYLEKIVTGGIAGYDSAALYLKELATDNELKKLSRSEHPVLRMVALRIIQERDSLDQFGFIMSHLDDTATVVVDNGEFGLKFSKVSDELLYHSTWNTIHDKNKTVEKVLLEHNNLRAAHTILKKLEANEKYYLSIKEMVQRYNYDKPYDETEYALYGLAKFKKKEDIPLIKKILAENEWRMEDLSFKLMEEYPDSSYTEILVSYGKHYFVENLRRIGWEMGSSEYDAVSFINALASCKNKKAAESFPWILTYINFLQGITDTESLKSSLYEAYWRNKCEAYSSILTEIKPYIEKQERSQITIEKEPYKGKTIISWFN